VCEHVLGTLCLVKTGSISYCVCDHCSFSGIMAENCILHEKLGHVSPTVRLTLYYIRVLKCGPYDKINFTVNYSELKFDSSRI
jgi:hypothetical protein